MAVLVDPDLYQVGRPWMFDGNRFLPETGMPIRKMACISRLFALAEPVPLTLASLKAKSLMRVTSGAAVFSESSTAFLLIVSGFSSVGHREIELLHVPRGGGTALGAQSAVDAEIFVLDHDAPGLRQGAGHEERLLRG